MSTTAPYVQIATPVLSALFFSNILHSLTPLQRLILSMSTFSSHQVQLADDFSLGWDAKSLSGKIVV